MPAKAMCLSTLMLDGCEQQSTPQPPLPLPLHPTHCPHSCRASPAQVPAADTAAFIAQLESIDTAYVNGVFADTNAAHAAATSGGAGAATLEPMEGITSLASSRYASPSASWRLHYQPPLTHHLNNSKAEVDGWRTKGLSAAAAGEVAALVLAGGQGTRLGFDRPKGEYNLGLPSNKVLFQLQADRIHKVRVNTRHTTT